MVVLAYIIVHFRLFITLGLLVTIYKLLGLNGL